MTLYDVRDDITKLWEISDRTRELQDCTLDEALIGGTSFEQNEQRNASPVHIHTHTHSNSLTH